MDASHRTSAKIYQFPLRRSANGRDRAEPKASPDRVSLRVSEPVVDANWYHEAAIQAAMQETTPPRDQR